ncbi:MAG: hypothetical protein AB7T07_03240 [Steroidobacteraceae bacterium]
MDQSNFSLRRELLIASLATALSALLLPGLIYVIGGRLFGAYGSTGGVLSLYRTTLTDVVVPKLTAWIIVFGPALSLLLLRLSFHLTRQTPESASQTQPPSRREPTINS